MQTATSDKNLPKKLYGFDGIEEFELTLAQEETVTFSEKMWNILELQLLESANEQLKRFALLIHLSRRK